MTRRVALFHSFAESQWVSCQTITSNLVGSLLKALGGHEVKVFDFNQSDNNYDFIKLIKAVHEFRPDRLVFCDHRPQPDFFIKRYLELFSKEEENLIPEIFVHVYGDFSLDLKEWKGINDLLVGKRIHFVCASDKQVKLVSNWINSPEGVVSKCPFSVDDKTFYFDPKLRQEIRKKLEVASDETLFLYTGRASLQKNIIELVKLFGKFLVETKSNARLLLAGQFDSIGNDFLGVELGEGHFYWYYHKALMALPEWVRDRIQYVGNLNKDEIRELCCASDYFTSLSVHNDEDFGMSPAEAFCCGLPAILTDWGGYHSFHLNEQPSYCQLVPTQIGTYKINIKNEKFLELLHVATKSRLTDDERQKISKTYHSIFSLEESVKNLKKIYSSETPIFHGFTKKFLYAADAYKMKKRLPFWEEDSAGSNVIRVYSPLYKEFYACYASEEF